VAPINIAVGAGRNLVLYRGGPAAYEARPVVDHRALGHSCGSAGKGDRKRIGIRQRNRGRGFICPCKEIVEIGRVIQHRLADHHDMFEMGQTVDYIGNFGLKRRLDDKKARACSANDGDQLVRRVGGGRVDKNGAGPRIAEMCNDIFRQVTAHNRDRVPLADAEAEHRVGETVRRAVEFVIIDASFATDQRDALRVAHGAQPQYLAR